MSDAQRERELVKKRNAWSTLVQPRSTYLKKPLEWYESDEACVKALALVITKRSSCTSSCTTRVVQRGGGEITRNNLSDYLSVAQLPIENLESIINKTCETSDGVVAMATERVNLLELIDNEKHGGNEKHVLPKNILEMNTASRDKELIKKRAVWAHLESDKSNVLTKPLEWFNSPDAVKRALRIYVTNKPKKMMSKHASGGAPPECTLRKIASSWVSRDGHFKHIQGFMIDPSTDKFNDSVFLNATLFDNLTINILSYINNYQSTTTTSKSTQFPVLDHDDASNKLLLALMDKIIMNIPSSVRNMFKERIRFISNVHYLSTPNRDFLRYNVFLTIPLTQYGPSCLIFALFNALTHGLRTCKIIMHNVFTLINDSTSFLITDVPATELLNDTINSYYRLSETIPQDPRWAQLQLCNLLYRLICIHETIVPDTDDSVVPPIFTDIYAEHKYYTLHTANPLGRVLANMSYYDTRGLTSRMKLILPLFTRHYTYVSLPNIGSIKSYNDFHKAYEEVDIIVIDFTDVNKLETNLPLDLIGNKYSLESVIIVYPVKNTPTVSHAICGYRINDDYQIHDSHYSYSHSHNWNHSLNIPLAYMWSPHCQYDDKSIHIAVAIYASNHYEDVPLQCISSLT